MTVNGRTPSAATYNTMSGEAAKHWIAGRWIDSADHRESADPATGEVIGSSATGGRL